MHKVMAMMKIKFKPKLHKEYLKHTLGILPSKSAKMDNQRVVLAFFAISGLDLLNELDGLSDEWKKRAIEWIYSLQVVDDNGLVSGFQGASTLNTLHNKEKNSTYKWSHIATTYAALCTLLILGDDLERVNRDSIIKSLRTLQLPDGCFKAMKEGTEHDMRFVFCAACICYILDDWNGMSIEQTVNFILESINYDFGIGQGPGLESHSGSTFCAVATLALANQLHRLSEQQTEGLIRWLVNRLDFGFNGRPNKPADTCYSFWTGGALKILNAYQYIENEDNEQFVLTTQNAMGGFAKWANTYPDPLHTYFGLAGLSLMKKGNLNAVHPELNISERAYVHLQSIHEKWRK